MRDKALKQGASKSMVLDRQWTVGRAIDHISRKAALENKNNVGKDSKTPM
jgi:hypothetical protein